MSVTSVAASCKHTTKKDTAGRWTPQAGHVLFIGSEVMFSLGVHRRDRPLQMLDR